MHHHVKDGYLKHFPKNCPHMNVTKPHWRLVNVSSGAGLVPSGNTPYYINQCWPSSMAAHGVIGSVCWSIKWKHHHIQIRATSKVDETSTAQISRHHKTRYVDGTPTSEVTPFTLRYIRPPHHGQYHGHEWMTHILFVPCQSAAPFLRYGNFRLWPWNSKVKVMGVVKGQCHTVGPVSCQLTSFSFHINQTNNSRDTAISKFDLEISKV